MQTKIRDSFHQLISIKSSLRLSLEKMWGKACKLVQPSWRGCFHESKISKIIQSSEPAILSPGVNANKN